MNLGVVTTDKVAFHHILGPTETTLPALVARIHELRTSATPPDREAEDSRTHNTG
eukprot:CAMPEP_0175975812 /NCGR_PEP_ID=MMETSP0108-20121206/44174_1 /TAXON_ID=195067 ORGANISM="Goniomonas pacifica, Strain CCMP1869" /NCGR_SAMPLE_ID=MMETSP0108 /ASSEMBLY_ACC=CAM_ASM_000204 /LENGTH=54 /DNA_ID=CAMNT_0017305645 /DNA_START=17 /DNA_END=177 /DNA_ORIENTATION=+